MVAKQPLNSELLTEIKAVKSMQASQARDIDVLKEWKRAEDAYRAALKAVRGEDAEEKRAQQDARLKSTAIKILTQLSPILAALGILLYAMANRGS
jgi:hypothetical protein